MIKILYLHMRKKKIVNTTMMRFYIKCKSNKKARFKIELLKLRILNLAFNTIILFLL